MNLPEWMIVYKSLKHAPPCEVSRELIENIPSEITGETVLTVGTECFRAVSSPSPARDAVIEDEVFAVRRLGNNDFAFMQIRGR